MFRNKRNSLVKRLWKYRVSYETKSPSQKDTSTSVKSSSSQEELEFKSVTHSFFKRLQDDQLETLLQAMESRGGEVTHCVSVSKSDLRIGKLTMAPYVLCCRLFRWPDLRSDAEMKRLPFCMRQNEDKDSVVCCNPYHWSVIVNIDEHPIHPDKFLRSAGQSQGLDESETSDGDFSRIIESTETGLTPSVYQTDLTGHTERNSGCDCVLWCTVAYWELRERVGRLFSVTEPSVHIFQQLPHGDGMCLRLLQKPTNLEAVKRTREKIGFGIILSREASCKNDNNGLQTEEINEDVTTTGTTLSVPGMSMSPPSRMSDPQPSCGERKCLSGEHGSNLCSALSTSTTDIFATAQNGVTKMGDSLDLVCDAGGGVYLGACEGQGFELHPEVDGCGSDYEQHFKSGPSHLNQTDFDSMDYTPTFDTSPPSFHHHHHVTQPQSRSSSSFSSSPPSSPPLPFNDTSFSDLDFTYISSNHGITLDASATAHTTNSHSNNNHTNNSSKKLPTTDNSSGNIKICRRTTSPQPIRNFSPSTTSPSPNTCTPCSAANSGLAHRKGEVWAYNASDFPIFVNSPTLDDPQSPRSLVVKKVPPGYSIKIYDYARAELLEKTTARSILLNDGPYDPCSVRISLAKGWGPSYSRQFITSCPCWLEILLGSRRHHSAS